jgi:hypothetical protein
MRANEREIERCVETVRRNHRRGTSAVASCLILSLLASCGAPEDATDDVQTIQAPSTIGNWIDAKIPPSVRSLASNAKTLMDGFSGVVSGIETAQKILQLMGFIRTGPTQEQMFNQLMAEIRSVGTATTYKLDQQAHSRTLGFLTQALGEAESLMNAGQPVFGFASTQDNNTGAAVSTVENDPTYFTRFFVESMTDGVWKSVVSKRPTVTNGLVYDWRLSVPALMQVIALRLQLMAAIDNKFKTGTLYDIELDRHKKALDRQFTKLVGGSVDGVAEPGAIHCDTRYWVGGYNDFSPPGYVPTSVPTAILVTVCADIYTGAFSRRDVIPSDFPNRPECTASYGTPQGLSRGVSYTYYVPATSSCAQEVKAELERDALSKLPLADLRTVIDDLAVYRDPAVKATLATTTCQNLANQYGIVAGATFGSAPSAEQTRWMKLGCGQRASWLDVAYARTRLPIDYDGDRKADVAVFRPVNGVWNISTGSAASVQWGANNDVPVPGDYVGDSKVDLAVWRPDGGNWIIRQVTPGSWWQPLPTVTSVVKQWGVKGDIPVPGDWDGDLKADPAVWRPSDGNFYVLGSVTGGWSWGVGAASTDLPVPADYNGDGRMDPVVWRPATGMWIGQTSLGGTISQQWGLPTDIPVPADYDGDKKVDIAVYRPLTGMWYVLPSTNPGYYTSAQWGVLGDVPVPGDYDGDAKADFTAFRPSTGKWYPLLSSTGNANYWEFTNGQTGDVPVP